MFPKIIEGVSCSVCGGSQEDYSKDYVIFECPECAKSFCAKCFDIDRSGNGQTVLCPHCGQTLQLPSVKKSP